MIREAALEILRLDGDAPAMPVGSTRTIAVERAAPGYLRYLYLRWGVQALAQIAGLAIVVFGIFSGEDVPVFVTVLEAFAVLSVAVHLFARFVMIRLDYELRWYVITDTSLHIREGVWNRRELTLSFQNVQNIKVTQGPLERLFGVSTIQVDTAGGGGAGAAAGAKPESGAVRQHAGYVRGIVEPVRIRDQMLDLVRRSRGPGLGEHVTPVPEGAAAAWSPAARTALAEAAAAARRLRAALTRE